ncbi:MAG: Asp23/Gls24 family envelope stress response protein [Oscillospiraceae bacterium]|nr:Asp23/Gls24 family envelope stress response protein [Oscillospiraceae bacterium]
MDAQHHHESAGGLVISDEVIAAIAVTAAKEIEGVSSIVPRTDVTRFLRLAEHLRLVKVYGGEAEVALQLSVRMQAGARLAAVAGELQAKMKEAVQNMTGRTVSRVNITVVGADLPHHQN